METTACSAPSKTAASNGRQHRQPAAQVAGGRGPIGALQQLEAEQVDGIGHHRRHQHLALDADVHHAGPLTQHAAERREGNRRRHAQRLRQGVFDAFALTLAANDQIEQRPGRHQAEGRQIGP